MYIIIHEPLGQTILADQEVINLEKFESNKFTTNVVKEQDIDFEMDEHNGFRIIIGKSVDQLFANFISNKIIIEAAGGMVINEDEKLLMIFRRGQWDMPKGKLDDGESIEECALREVEEETGLHSLHLGHKLQITYHTYSIGSQVVIKPSHWYLMNFIGEEAPIPQTEEDITEIRWVDKKEAAMLLELMFPSIKEMVEKHFLA
jgi:8-oxo-dGTP pyrophosphatase MutT (NUDIX family)